MTRPAAVVGISGLRENRAYFIERKTKVRYGPGMTQEEFDKLLEKDAGLKQTVEIMFAEQWKFSAEPVLSKTGKGFLRSSGVSELAATKEEMKKSSRNGGSTE